MNDQTRAVLGIIPARGGSKGIVRKNIRLLAGKPLIAYTASAALQSSLISSVVLSTDDPEIAEIGRSFGLESPFIRPAELARDTTPMFDVVLHALRSAQDQGKQFAAICLLQPTSPLRSSQTIDRCIAALWDPNVDSVMSVRPVPPEYNPHWVYFEQPNGLLKLSTGESEPIPARQLLPDAYHRDGSVFVARTEVVMKRNSLYGASTLGVISPESEACDLDSEEQWQALEMKLASADRGTGPSA